MLLGGEGEGAGLAGDSPGNEVGGDAGDRRWCEVDGAFKGGNSRRNLGGEQLGLSAAAVGQGGER